jgi:4-amino-4-deoxy-L-arabinose transferase-like glycosyltransferase
MRARPFVTSVAFLSLLVVAFAVRVAWVHHTQGTPLTIDAADYERHARSIADGHGFPPSQLASGPSAYRPPGYPVFLAAVYKITGGGWPTARYVECLVGTLTVALVGLLAVSFWDRRLALIATAIAAIFPPMINISTAVLSEAIFVPLVLGATLVVLHGRAAANRTRWVVLAGVLVGLAWLARGNGFLLLLPFAAALWQRRQGWRAAAMPALLVAMTLLTIAPWTIRNAIVMHAFVPVSNESGLTLAGTYNPTAAHYRYRATWLPPTADPQLFKLVAQKLDPHYHGPRYTEMEVASRMDREAKSYITHHPLYVVTVAVANARRWLRLTGDPRGIVDAEEPPLAVPLRDYTVWVLLLLGIAGLFHRARRRVPFFVWVVPLLMATTIFVSGWLRMRAPVDPFLVLLAALGVSLAFEKARGAARSRGRVAAPRTPAAA